MSDGSSGHRTDALETTAPAATRAAGRLIGGAVVAVLFMGSTLLTPLYDIYSATFGMSVLSLGLLYAVYVIGNVVALLFLGRLSDQVGRRPIVLASLVLAILSSFIFWSAHGPATLFVGRVINGLAVGLGSGAATAWITEFTLEEGKAGAATVMTAFNFVGLALGSMLAGFLVQYQPDPLRLPFEIYLAILAAVVLLVRRVPETLQRMQGSPVDLKPRLDLRPRLGVPRGMRLMFAAPAAGGFAAMAIVGFYAALGPTTIQQSLHITNRAVGGLVVAELFVIAVVAIIATRNMKPRTTMMIGLTAIPIGVVLLVAAQRLGSLPLMLLSAGACGLSAALGYRGGLAVVNASSPPQRRAEVASTYFVCCFLGNALPIIGLTALSSIAGATLANTVFACVLSLIGIGAVVIAASLRTTSSEG